MSRRMGSYAMVLGMGFLLLVSLVVTAALTAFDHFLESWMPGAGLLLKIIHFVVSLGVIAFLFAAIYKFLPDAQVAWKDVAIGALMTAILFNLGKYLIGLYIGRSGIASEPFQPACYGERSLVTSVLR